MTKNPFKWQLQGWLQQHYDARENQERGSRRCLRSSVDALPCEQVNYYWVMPMRIMESYSISPKETRERPRVLPVWSEHVVAAQRQGNVSSMTINQKRSHNPNTIRIYTQETNAAVSLTLTCRLVMAAAKRKALLLQSAATFFPKSIQTVKSKFQKIPSPISG